MSSSELSELSSALSSEDENASEPTQGGVLTHYLKKGGGKAIHAPPPAKKQRPASPPHEYVLADNPDIAVICMFRSRFSDAFPKSLGHYGPQDIESGVEEPVPGEQVEKLLCALLGLVLNRKKDVERGHFQRALEEAVQSHASQWPLKWQGKNPLHGGGNFTKMGPAERLTLLKALVLWSLSSSEAIQTIIKESYKQQRRDDDLNQPLSVQPWGRDGDKRRYWLIEGQEDTHFRLYRESNPVLKHNTWQSVTGSIDGLKTVATRLGEDGTQASRRLRDRITQGIPRFEVSEEKRKRREYRNTRKAQFVRPEPGFSLYEGRTRGKRIRYTFSDEEDGGSDAPVTRRSNRQTGVPTPVELAGPTFTASGRQVRSRVGGAFGESLPTGQQNAEAFHVDDISATKVGDTVPNGRTRQSALRNGLDREARSRTHIEGYNALDEMEEESDAASSGVEWDGGDDDDVDEQVVDEEEDEDADMSDDEVSIADEENEVAAERKRPRSSLVVALRYQKVDDAPITDSNVSEQVPRPTVSHEQQPSWPSRLSYDSRMTGYRSSSKELSSDKPNDPNGAVSVDSTTFPSFQVRPSKEHGLDTHSVPLAATNQ